ncbi:M15 family metallopeptidase [Kitasatospora cystarginea]|uniref:D-alanyl-D-alanine dipeptidase n=1 Tax=Kitasatospora cystarginea TaxID=58350 RepID=A0ABP5RLX8_9ACTN
MTEIILMADPRVATIPTQDNGDKLADIRRETTLPVDDRRSDPAGAFAHVRTGVLTRLIQAQMILPDGLRLLVVEGYRPPALQREYFDRYATRLRTDHPDWDAERLRSAASRFVAPPELAPHSAGAAIDLTLIGPDGNELDMGTRVNANPEESNGACYTGADNITAEARANRRILSDAMTAADFVNYPTEWWHWSYGDRYWALTIGAPAALYGPAERTN